MQADPLEPLRPDGTPNVPSQGKAAGAGVWHCGKLTEMGSTLCWLDQTIHFSGVNGEYEGNTVGM